MMHSRPKARGVRGPVPTTLSSPPRLVSDQSGTAIQSCHGRIGKAYSGFPDGVCNENIA